MLKPILKHKKAVLQNFKLKIFDHSGEGNVRISLKNDRKQFILSLAQPSYMPSDQNTRFTRSLVLVSIS